MGANDDFAEAIIGLAVDLQRVSAAARGRILRMLEQLVTELEEELGKAGLDAVRTSTRLRRAEALLKQVQRTLNRGYGEMNLALRSELIALAVFVAPEVRVLAREVFKADLFSTIPDERTLKVLARDSIIRGGPARQWWAKQSADTFNRFATELRMGILRGEPTPQIVNRLFGKQVGSIVVSVPVKTRKLKERRGIPPDPTQPDSPKPKKIKTRKVIVPRRTGGVFDVSRREAEALVRTAIQNVSNEVLEQTYEANSDVLRGYQWLATLDTRTSPICRSLDGGSWNLKTGLPLPESPVRRKFPGRPPIHFNCRSILTPVIKSWEQLSGGRFTAEAFSEGTRASMDGQVPARLDYEAWLRKQPKHRQLDVLGPGRYQLWQRGLTVRDLVGQDGRPRTIEQLKRLKALKRQGDR